MPPSVSAFDRLSRRCLLGVVAGALAATTRRVRATPVVVTPPGPVPVLDTLLANSGGEAEIVHVRNLNASGPGSFREAVTATTTAGNGVDRTRIVVFDVAGEIDLGHDAEEGGDIRRAITIERENLWVAGQTAPAGGITLKGRLSLRRGWLVFEHLRIQPIDGAPNDAANQADGRAIKFFPNRGSRSRYPASEYTLFRNLTLRATQDVAMAVGGLGYKGTQLYYPENFAVDNCLFAEPLNINIHSGQRSYFNGHNRGFNWVDCSYRGLLRGCLHASSQFRAPQFTQMSSGIVVNCFTFNYGVGADATWPNYPIVLNYKSARRSYFENVDDLVVQPERMKIKAGLAGCYFEGGSRTYDPGNEAGTWVLPGWPSANNDVSDLHPDFVGSAVNEFWDAGDNKLVSYYDPATAPTDADAAANNPNLAETPYYEVTTVDRASPFLVNLASPPFPLTRTRFTADEARRHCLDYAGAWPGVREDFDRQVIEEVAARTHVPAGRTRRYTPQATIAGQPPAIPDDPGDGVRFDDSHPLQTASDRYVRLTRLEAWLVDRHLAAGGCPATVWDAAEWLTRVNVGEIR